MYTWEYAFCFCWGDWSSFRCLLSLICASVLFFYFLIDSLPSNSIIESGIFKSWTIIVKLLISYFNSFGSCFKYLRLCCVYVFNCYIFLMSPFIIINFPFFSLAIFLFQCLFYDITKATTAILWLWFAWCIFFIPYIISLNV